MIPLKIDKKISFPPATIGILIVCITLHFQTDLLASLRTGFIPVDFMYALFHPASEGVDALGSLMVSFFLHANALHLITNMWYLILFGIACENRLGSIRFSILYVMCGSVSMIVQGALAPLSTVPVVGASGAIAGIMGGILVLLPLSRIVMWVPPVFFVKIPSILFCVIWFFTQYISMRSMGDRSLVAYGAHLGGFLWGVTVMALFCLYRFLRREKHS